jgi:hypothetical protein
MKKFALFAMLLTAGFLTMGCAEKPKDKPKETPAAGATDAGTEKPADVKPDAPK